MIVIRKDGRAVVLSGWRAWLAGAAAFAIAFALVALITFVLLGLAFTAGVILLVVVPVAVVLTLLAWLFGGR